MQYEDEIAKLHFYINQVLPNKFLKTFDSLIESGNEPSNDLLAQNLTKKIQKLVKTIEMKSTKQIEALCRQVAKPGLSSRRMEKSLQMSMEQLRQSLNESERAIEESMQRRTLGEHRNLCEEVKPTMSLEGSLQKRDSVRMSQQCKAELDMLNDDHYNTDRTVSFGIPEHDTEDGIRINDVLNEYKKKIEQQKYEEFDTIVQKLKIEFNQEIERTSLAMSVAKENWQNKEKYYKESIEMIKKDSFEQLNKLEDAKNKEIEGLIKLKEEEIKSNLSIENMKIVNEKKNELTRQYMENRENLLKDFESLKEKLYNEVEAKTTKIEKEYQDLISESDNRKIETERKFKERVEEKEKLMDNIMKMRIKEIEEDHRIESEKLSYNLKYEAQCQTERQRAEFTQKQKEVEDQYKSKIEELEGKMKLQANESRKIEDQLKDELKRLREDEDQKCDQVKKKIEKELMTKIEQLQRKQKETDDRINKIRKDCEDESKKVMEDKEIAIENISKKYKEEAKAQKDKHRAEIRNLKEAHKNELIKKTIEKDREIKKLNELHMEDLEKVTKETEERKSITKSSINGILYFTNI